MTTRLDVHSHWYGDHAADWYGGTMVDLWRPVIERLGITHFVAIAQDADLESLSRMPETGARGIPFHWLDMTKEDPFSELPVAGHKIHLRQTPPTAAGPVLASSKDVGRVCDRAGELGRPVLFHTDADDPSPNSVPMLAQLARELPGTSFIAGHAGVYGQETFEIAYAREVAEPMFLHLWRMNLRLMLETPNLYGDTTKFGMDFPHRSDSPYHRMDTFIQAVQEFPRPERRALCAKLFCGTDFPNFRVLPSDGELSHGLSHEVVAASDLGFQIRCLEEAFDDLFDEEDMARRFFDLLPEPDGWVI